MTGAEASEIDGVWAMVRAEFDGAPAPKLVVQNTILELARGEYRVHLGAEVVDAGTFQLDGSSKEKTMLLRGIEGPNSGRTIPCIYQLIGNRLRVCFGLDGAAPPGFVASKGRTGYLATYRRRLAQP